MSFNVTVTRTTDKLEREMRRIPVKAATGMARAVRTRAEQGNRRAKALARKSAGTHGKHYPDSFLVEALGPFDYVYGPSPSIAQGEMSFEYGSRNQPPHLDLNKSADIVGPALGKDMEKLLGRLFW